MVDRIFTLEALQADHGDCLLLHYGDASSPRIIAIDGGPKGIYARSLNPRLQRIKSSRGSNPLGIRLLMVSHIDDDHITGVLDLMADLRAAQAASQPLPYDILTLWHNSFDDLVKKLSAEAQSAIRIRAASSKSEFVQAIATSVPQGRQLRLDADALALNMNPGFPDLISFTKDRGPVDMGQGLKFTVLGPRQKELDDLQNKWAAEVKKIKSKQLPKSKTAKTKKVAGGSAVADNPLDLDVQSADAAAIAAEFVDKSIPNLSSIVVLAESGDKSILLTGDARGDLIIDSLKDAKLLKNGTIAVDVLKMPHHGSNRDVAVRFFTTILADHYVFSANGKYNNPDSDTFEMLFKARPKARYTLWLTNAVPAAINYIKKNKPAGVTVKIREDAALSLKVDLEHPIAF